MSVKHIDVVAAAAGDGSSSARKYYEGPTANQGDVHIRIRYFTYETAQGLVAGRNTNHLFTIDRPAKDIWPYLKDFNLWQNPYGFYYSDVVGDIEGSTFTLSTRIQPNEKEHQNRYESLVSGEVDPHGPLRPSPFKYLVLKSVPEHLIAIHQPVPEDGSTGGISPGFHLFMLNEHEGKTVVTIYTEHATRTIGKSEEEALSPYKVSADETVRKFRDNFIPTLKKLVSDGK